MLVKHLKTVDHTPAQKRKNQKFEISYYSEIKWEKDPYNVSHWKVGVHKTSMEFQYAG